MDFLTSLLLQISTMLWVNFHILVPWLPTPKEEIPIVDLTTHAPEDVDHSRMAPCEWLSLWDVYDDAYGTREPRLRADYSAQLDQFVARVMNNPRGRRCMHEWHWANSGYVNPRFNLLGHPGNACRAADGSVSTYTDFNNRVRPFTCPWFEEGIKESATKWKWLMSELKRRGLQLDFFTTENESAYTPWAFVPGQTQALDADPRIKEVYEELKITSITETSNFFNHRDDFIKMNDYFGWKGYLAFIEGMYKPILEVFPGVKISDYAKMCIKVNTWETNGWPMISKYCDPSKMVSNGTDLFYLGGGAFLQYQHGNAETGYLENTPWNAFIMSMNQAYAIRLSNPNKPFWPSMAENHLITWSTPELYKEHWRHLALLVDGFVLWGPDPNAEDYRILNEIFKELDPFLGFADKKSTITKLIDWNAKEIRTCARANKKEVCRVTRKDGTGFWN